MAERGGFEPPSPVSRTNGFRDRRIQPLCHLSARLVQGAARCRRVRRALRGREVAEREGFEPSRQVTPPTRFPVAPFTPTRPPRRGPRRGPPWEGTKNIR